MVQADGAHLRDVEQPEVMRRASATGGSAVVFGTDMNLQRSDFRPSTMSRLSR
jgi:hypothetical protein